MTPLTFQTLRLLADGEFRSGEAMARALGVTRASVWNALHRLDGAGLEIFKVRGRGYRLSQPLCWLEHAAIERALAARANEFTLEVLDVATSTNTLLMQRAGAGAASGSVIAAEWQTGRAGRPEHAQQRFQQGAGTLSGLSLAVGVALTRALARLGLTGVGLKWPNDAIWQGCKLAGILIELQGEANGPSAAVIGIGINCRLPAALRDRIDQPVADLAQIAGVDVDRNRLLAVLLIELADALRAFAHGGFAPLREEWQARHVYQNEPVRLTLPEAATLDGIAQGVDDNGALLIETAGGVRRVHSGEVSLRLQRGA